MGSGRGAWLHAAREGIRHQRQPLCTRGGADVHAGQHRGNAVSLRAHERDRAVGGDEQFGVDVCAHAVDACIRGDVTEGAWPEVAFKLPTGTAEFTGEHQHVHRTKVHGGRPLGTCCKAHDDREHAGLCAGAQGFHTKACDVGQRDPRQRVGIDATFYAARVEVGVVACGHGACSCVADCITRRCGPAPCTGAWACAAPRRRQAVQRAAPRA